jgi:N utilization substance protein B
MRGPRRRAREIALQILFQSDANTEIGASEAVDLYLRELDGSTDEDGETSAASLPTAERAWIAERVRGVERQRADLDAKLASVSRHWRVERMSRLDRTILRLGLFELLEEGGLSHQVVINEAVELAKRYGSEEAPAFVNGILDSAMRTFPRGP